MADLGLLASEGGDREALGLMLGELGFAAHPAARLEEAVELARERRAKAIVLVDGAGADAEKLTRELIRAFPLLPVVVAMRARDASRAVALMRVGAAEVIAPPWTREDLKASVSKGLRFQGTALSPAGPAPQRRSAIWYALALGLFAAAALGTASLKRVEEKRAAEAAVVHRWDLPVRHPAGLAYDGKSVWVVDWFTQSFYALAPADGVPVRVVRHLTAETPVAAAFTGDSMWTVSADGSIIRRMRDDKLTPLARYKRAAPSSAGLAFDGLYLWTLDARAKVLRKHLVDRELTVMETYKWRGGKPAGVIYDGRSLWTLDAAASRLERRELERPDEVTAAITLGEYANGAYVPRGLGWDGKSFWTVAEAADGKGPARLTRHKEEAR